MFNPGSNGNQNSQNTRTQRSQSEGAVPNIQTSSNSSDEPYIGSYRSSRFGEYLKKQFNKSLDEIDLQQRSQSEPLFGNNGNGFNQQNGDFPSPVVFSVDSRRVSLSSIPEGDNPVRAKDKRSTSISDPVTNYSPFGFDLDDPDFKEEALGSDLDSDVEDNPVSPPKLR